MSLTSVLIKCLERILLRYLKEQTCEHLDQHQFAYRQNRGTDDAIQTLIQYTHSHLDTQNSRYARILFADFSSAFNTIQTHILAQKLQLMKINPYQSIT